MQKTFTKLFFSMLCLLGLSVVTIAQSGSSATVSVDMNQYDGDFTTVYLSGGFNGWAGGDNPMSDDDMDGVWEVTVMMPDGDNEYKFQLDQWNMQEEFAGGEDCTLTTGDFTNRLITINGDTVAETVCYNSCSACGEDGGGGETATDGMITLSVDMNEYEGEFGVVYLSGGFNGWAGGDNPMSDDDMDGVWEVTVMMPAGANEYKFQLDQWNMQEEFAGGEECTITVGDFTNRLINVDGDATIGTVCYNACAACGDGGGETAADGMITLSVDMNEYEGEFGVVYLSGGFNGWAGGDNPMSDDDMDGVWEVTVMMPAGANEYKFQLDQWNMQEEFAGGEECTITVGDFTNRLINVDGDATIGTVCYNACAACGDGGGETAADGMITLSVDMNNYTGDFTTVYLSGGFNGWAGGDNPMSDDDMDGVWEVTVMMPAGANEYKFQLDQWNMQEEFAGGEECTITVGDFTNRLINVDGDATIATVCYNSCTACDEAVGGMITLSVDMNEYEGEFGVVYLSGGFNGWAGGDNPMSDDDMDGVWEVTVMMPAGANEYKFQLDQWNMQEEFAGGEECTITVGDFTNRLLQVNGDATIGAVCYNSCTACGGDGGGGDAMEGMVTVSVDMAGYAGEFTTVFLSGAFNGWAGADNPMSDDDLDGVWETTVLLPAGANEYKFQVDEWTDQEMLAEGSACTITTGDFTNRIIDVDGDATVETVCWNSCTACGSEVEGMITVSVDMNNYDGEFGMVYLSGGFNGWSGDANPMSDDDMDGVYTVTVLMPAGANEYKIQLDQWTTQEEFAGGEACTVTDPSGQFVNRLVVVNGDAVLPVVCYNSCEDCAAQAVLSSLPLTFEEEGFDYVVNGFGAADLGELPAEVIDNPDATGVNTTAKVVSFLKDVDAQVWAGASMPLGSVIDLGNGQFSMQVWAPRVDVPFLLKFEDTTSEPDGNGNPSIIAELVVNNTVANAWETLMYDMTTATGYSPDNQYDQIVVFTDFGTAGAGETFYFDNIQGEVMDGIRETLDDTVGLSVYPNPAKDIATIALGLPTTGQVSYQVTDIVGRTLQAENLGQLSTGAHQTTLYLNALPAGTYFLLLNIDQQVVQFEKIVVNK